MEQEKEETELSEAISRHIKVMMKRAVEALQLTGYIQGTVETIAPWIWEKDLAENEIVNNNSETISSLFQTKGEKLERYTDYLISKNYKLPDSLVGLQAILLIGLNYYNNLLENEDFSIIYDLPKLLKVDEIMGEVFSTTFFVSRGAAPFTKNLERTRKTNSTRREGSDETVLQVIEKLKARDPKKQYTKTGLAAAIYKELPGDLPTQRTIQNSLDRLFFQKTTIKRGEKITLHFLFR